jgi:hypothetical protein
MAVQGACRQQSGQRSSDMCSVCLALLLMQLACSTENKQTNRTRDMCWTSQQAFRSQMERMQKATLCALHDNPAHMCQKLSLLFLLPFSSLSALASSVSAIDSGSNRKVEQLSDAASSNSAALCKVPPTCSGVIPSFHPQHLARTDRCTMQTDRLMG